MTYQSYELSRYVGDDADHGTSFTVADDDAINCAHMLAAGFNTISRKMMGDFVLGVVDTKAGTVQYDGKTEKLYRPETVGPDEWPANLFFSKTFNFEGSPLGESLITFFGDSDETTYIVRGDVKADEPLKYAHLSRSVLIDAYAELQAVKEVLADAGVEMTPAESCAIDLRALLRARDELIADLKRTLVEIAPVRNAANEAARAELIEYVKGAYLKKNRLTLDDVRHDLEDRFRGMLDVLAKFLVVTGEADASEGHAVARRLCGVPDGEV